jgi:hypothetical protein
MANLETVANPAIVTTIVLSACLLGIGFMVRFFVALTVEGREMHSRHGLRLQGVHSQKDIACAAAPSRKPTLNSAAWVAMGVVRITTALASTPARRNDAASHDGLHAVTLDRPSQEFSFPAGRRYRSS